MISTKHIDKNGNEIWLLPNAACHREDGPAYVARGGYQAWYINGMSHREDGPAIIFPDGTVDWYLNDIWHSFDDYCARLKRDYGKTDEDIMMLRMQYEVN